MDWSKKKRAKLVSESCEEIQTKCGCITLKGVVRSCLYDHGFGCDVVEMTAPFAGIKRVLHLPEDYIFDITSSFGAKALQKIYRDVLKERRCERYLQHNKAKIAEVLPIWFANDAQIGFFDASERTARRGFARQAQRGEISTNDISKHIAPVRAMMELNRKATMRQHEQEIDIALRLRDLRALEFNYNDACRLFGEDIWVQLLERSTSRAEDDSKMSEVAIIRFRDFAFLYDMPLPKVEEGDILEGIGFGKVMLAAALRRNGEVVAVGAIDDVRGRKALRALVGNERLAEMLPKRVYQAVTRHEQFYVQGLLCYTPPKRISNHNNLLNNMKQRYTIGNYVKISQLDDEGNATIILAEAEMPLKVVVSKELQVRPCERNAEWINLGVVSEVRNYKKRSRIEVRTDKGWYSLEVNAGLECVMTDFMHFGDN